MCFLVRGMEGLGGSLGQQPAHQPGTTNVQLCFSGCRLGLRVITGIFCVISGLQQGSSSSVVNQDVTQSQNLSAGRLFRQAKTSSVL